MLCIKRAGYAGKVVSVTIPPDSGRRMTAFLSPGHPTEVRQAWNIADLQSRRAWSDPLKQLLYTREDIQKHDIVWIWDVVSMAARTKVDLDCAVVVNGGPALAELSTLVVDDVESVEILNGGGGRPWSHAFLHLAADAGRTSLVFGDDDAGTEWTDDCDRWTRARSSKRQSRGYSDSASRAFPR